MIPVLVLFVSCAFLAPFPTLAIPSPDFLGPAIAWMATFAAFVSAGFGILLTWAHRFLKPLGFSRRGTMFALTGLLLLSLALIGTVGLTRYYRAQEEFQRLVREQEKLNTTSTPPILPSSSTSTQIGPLSSRVGTSTLLVPIDVLREMAQSPTWADDLAILDIREPEERLIGYIPATSTFLRYGDLINGAAKDIPRDKDLLVICWTSSRGSEIATWLRQNGFPRAYAILGGLQGDTGKGVVGWMDSGLPWYGSKKWSDRFVNFRYLSFDQAVELYQRGAVVIDTRDEEKYRHAHIHGAFSLPIKHLPSSVVSSTIAMLPPKKPLLVYCSDWVDCFYARIIGERLKFMGWSFDVPFRDDNGAWFQAGYPTQR